MITLPLTINIYIYQLRNVNKLGLCRLLSRTTGLIPALSVTGATTWLIQYCNITGSPWHFPNSRSPPTPSFESFTWNLISSEVKPPTPSTHSHTCAHPSHPPTTSTCILHYPQWRRDWTNRLQLRNAGWVLRKLRNRTHHTSTPPATSLSSPYDMLVTIPDLVLQGGVRSD